MVVLFLNFKKTNMKPYFGGTGITLGKLKAIMPTHGIDGTQYKIENWLKECELFDNLKPGAKVWVPYGGAQEFGVLKEVVWKQRFNFKHYTAYNTEETKDWYIEEPYLLVELNGLTYHVYEISFYKKWKRKTQLNHIDRVRARGKQKFISRKEIGKLKQQEAIDNRNRKKARICI